ncbi:hypothetical protein [Maridesulfovibrio hydrothermalis]|uniref:DUF106 domain-containing protein n=1 Tax=Maridesulfovibrio hydrothermalis AM13 = DSM 14728 TaxID=1121451 RepID=L0RFY0_9BACT|nr:hypothetical protein [Maridesulfovibrio hydrothermalis]CCO25115.1 conserved membrane protein of unknown function [Maridesulfovibrio hydrothermalis AM13 = DSM 14728]
MIDFDSIYPVIDTMLITPYRIGLPAAAAFWMGTALIAFWCTIAGELSMAVIYIWNREYYTDLNRKMTRMHNISVAAIRHKKKDTFKSANKWANEYFGKVFFSHAALFAVSLWPVPFALAWLQERFTGIDIHTIPYTEFGLGYPFVFILSYILVRYGFSKVRQFIPLMKKIDKMRADDAEKAGQMTSWSELVPADTKNAEAKISANPAPAESKA